MQVDFYYEFGRNRICSEMLFVKIFHFHCIKVLSFNENDMVLYI